MKKETTIGALAGIAAVVLVHGALAAGYAVYVDGMGSAAHDAREITPQKAPPLFCHEDQRCNRLEARQKRREPEPPPYEEPEVLEAAMVPALGGVLPDKEKLPEIEQYEQPEIHEDAVNLDKSPSELNKLIKDVEHKEEKVDKTRKEKLDELLKPLDPDDPRARAKKIENLTGFKEGEIGGQGMEVRLGSIYSTAASKAIRKYFTLPPFFDDATLRKLSVKILVKKMNLDGSIEEFEIKKKSGDASFDSAALAAIKQFVDKEGGEKKLPPPDPEVLRYINQKGLLIQFDGRVIRLQ